MPANNTSCASASNAADASNAALLDSLNKSCRNAVTYDIRIDEYQRRIIEKALCWFRANLAPHIPGEDCGMEEVTVLSDLFQNTEDMPLQTTGINDFTE